MVNKGRQGGFTIIEMLTVIGIIGVLAALIFPIVGAAKKKAHEGQCFSNLHTIYMAVKQFQLDERQSPDFIAGPVEWADASNNISYAPGGTLVPLNKTNGQVNGKVVSLYPEYIDAISALKCPLADLNGDDAEYKPDNPTDIVSDIMYLLLGGAAPNKNGLRGLGTGSNQPFYLYKYSSYDYQKPRNLYQAAGAGEVHYSPSWLDMNKSVSRDDQDVERQLMWKIPPSDTVVTWCSYHRDSDPTGQPRAGSMDIVLFLDGHAKRMPSNLLVNWTNAWRVKPM